jgi:hypothetical protein
MGAPIWDVTVFTKNREWLLEGDVARSFFQVDARLVSHRPSPSMGQLLMDKPRWLSRGLRNDARDQHSRAEGSPDHDRR